MRENTLRKILRYEFFVYYKFQFEISIITKFFVVAHVVRFREMIQTVESAIALIYVKMYTEGTVNLLLENNFK